MTPDDMVTHVSGMLRDKKHLSLIGPWLTLAAKNLAARFNFRELLDNTKFITTIANTASYDLDSSLYRLYNVWMPSNNTRLHYVNELQLLKMDPKYLTQTGTAARYYQKGRQIGIWKVPTGVSIINYSMFVKPGAIASGDTNEYRDIPEEWHPVIIQKALTLGYQFEGNPQWQTSIQYEDKLIKEIKPSLVNMPGLDRVMSEEIYTPVRMGRPKLPSNYP